MPRNASSGYCTAEFRGLVAPLYSQAEFRPQSTHCLTNSGINSAERARYSTLILPGMVSTLNVRATLLEQFQIDGARMLPSNWVTGNAPPIKLAGR